MSNTVYDAEVQQADAVTTTGCWWGAETPEDGRVWDGYDEFTRGVLDRGDYATGWVGW